MKKKLFKTRLLSFAAFCGLTLAFASCANEDVAQNPNNTDNDKNLTTFSAGDPTTRTSMESDGKFFWEAGDKIYVKDDNNTWHASSNSPTGKTDNFKFKVPGTYTAHTSYEVYYPGQGGSNDQAKISASQSQAEPNTTTHFGAAGDCGMATATKVPGKQQFAFTLDHKAAYLLFLPRTSNTILHDCYLTKVEVNSDDDITSTYTLNPTTGELTGTGSGKQIVLETKGSGTYANGFPLTNSTASAATNGAYMVIKPGTHTLKIRYWVKDVATGVEGTITKILASATYDQNKYYNITANLNVRDYDGNHYYQWDAQEQYWKGYEWYNGGSQPTLDAGYSPNYAQNSTDLRYYNEIFPGNGISNPATHTSFNNIPNANEMSWYVVYGNPRWDGDELWTTMGHLYKGGMWFKKKSVLQAENHYDTEKFAHGSLDLRTKPSQAINYNLSIKILGAPSAADANNYFYLPALGFYRLGSQSYVGNEGYYWTSSANPSWWQRENAYYLYFTNDGVSVGSNRRDYGYRAQPFSDFGDN
ncbi:hypothetical protein J4861_11035 [Prevotella melaninogenica]|uniref:hypothetical protein n=1 Tax=Prevotella melaninogenica TaxID=28132 RepID=UPI001BA7B396|nr:hypothetical protein [Prevotella melaninogenica]QUB61323.1 hypothetical protein J4861_11035 [Prevotella melaninogenica]